MPRNNRPEHLRPRGSSHSGRRINSRSVRKTFLILCEGAKTEPSYFLGFRLAREVVEIVGMADNTLHLVREAVQKRQEFAERGITFDQVWCVFDRDSFPAQNFNEAIRLARAEGMHVAYTNQAFELWYLLHFDYHTSALHRWQYADILADRLGFRYKKNDSNMYEVLRARQPTAIRNARRLLREYEDSNGIEVESAIESLREVRGLNPEADNPSTTVHCLVEELNKEIAARSYQ